MIATARERMSTLTASPSVARAGSVVVLSLAAAFTALLVGRGLWFLIVGMVLAIPAALAFHRNPLLALGVWLAIDPFLQAVQAVGTGRKLYWLVHRALPVAILGLMVLARLAGLTRRRLRFGVLELLAAGYLGVSALSIQYASPDVLATSYLLYDRVAIPMALFLLVRWCPPGRRNLDAAVPILGFLLISQCLIGLLQWANPGLLPDDYLDRAGARTTGSLDHPNVFGLVLLAAGALLFHLGHGVEKPRFPRWMYSTAFAVAMFANFATLSRAAWLATFATAVVVAFAYPAAMRRLAAAGVAVALVVVVAAPIDPLIDRVQTRFFSEQSEESALSRLPVVVASIRMFEAKPLVGWGFGNFDLYDRQFQGRVGDLFVPDKDHASHNLYLTILAEQGAIGFLLYLAPVAILLWKTPAAFRRLPARGPTSRRYLAVLWTIPLATFIVSNFSNTKIPYGLGIYWLSLGLIAGLVMPLGPEVDPEAVRMVEPTWKHE